MRAIYSILLIVIRPFVHLRLKWRARKAPGYGQRVDERFGHVPPDIPRGALWIHTVSAGETIAAAPLIKRLIVELSGPKIPLLVTTMTPTGSAEVVRLFGDSVSHCYAPYDFADGVRRFLDAAQPRALVLMETEIWPNMITMTAARNIPIALVNARLSARSARGYARVQTLLSPVLRSLSWIACQHAADAKRFRELGASPAQIEVVGNIKFDVADIPIGADQRMQLRNIEERAALKSRPVWVAGSTHSGEDSILLTAHRQLVARVPNACLIIVPRHPERFTEVSELAEAEFATDTQSAVRLSQWLAATPNAQSRIPSVIVVDVMGLLRPLYTLCDVAFIGGSLVALGGHNPIEAAVARVPILMGPGRFNFVAVSEAFAQANCLHMVANAQELVRELAALFADDELRQQQGDRAAALVTEHAGATARLSAQLTRITTGTATQ